MAAPSEERLTVLKQLIREGTAHTQEELCDALRKEDFEVTQATVSRDLRRIGAIKATDSEGKIIYKLPEDHINLSPQVSHTLGGLVTEIQSNTSMIVVHTTAGSASLVARHLDSMRASVGIIGTIAGDDTILVVPAQEKKISKVIKRIQEEVR